MTPHQREQFEKRLAALPREPKAARVALARWQEELDREEQEILGWWHKQPGPFKASPRERQFLERLRAAATNAHDE